MSLISPPPQEVMEFNPPELSPSPLPDPGTSDGDAWRRPLHLQVLMLPGDVHRQACDLGRTTRLAWPGPCEGQPSVHSRIDGGRQGEAMSHGLSSLPHEQAAVVQPDGTDSPSRDCPRARLLEGFPGLGVEASV